MRVFTGLFCWWCGLTNKLFECPGVRIVRQYKNDGKEKYYCPKTSFNKCGEDLVRVQQTTHTVFNTEDVVIYGIEVVV